MPSTWLTGHAHYEPRVSSCERARDNRRPNVSRSAWSMLFTLAATTALTACSGSSSTTTAPATTPSRTQVVAVSPVGGATGIDPAAPIVVSFSHAMRAGAQIYVSLHE